MTFSAERQAQKSMSGSVFPEAHQDRSTFLARGAAELPCSQAAIVKKRKCQTWQPIASD
jgi:hypothetical protein